MRRSSSQKGREKKGKEACVAQFHCNIGALTSGNQKRNKQQILPFQLQKLACLFSHSSGFLLTTPGFEPTLHFATRRLDTAFRSWCFATEMINCQKRKTSHGSAPVLDSISAALHARRCSHPNPAVLVSFHSGIRLGVTLWADNSSLCRHSGQI